MLPVSGAVPAVLMDMALRGEMTHWTMQRGGSLFVRAPQWSDDGRLGPLRTPGHRARAELITMFIDIMPAGWVVCSQ